MTAYQIAALAAAACVAIGYAWPVIKKLTPAALLQHVFAVVAAVALVVAFMPPKTIPVTPDQTQVQTILKSASKLDRARVAAFYAAMADVVERDDKVISTVGMWRRVNSAGLDLAFKGTDLPGKYSGLDKAIDDMLVAAIGKEDVALSLDKRQVLVATLKEISNAAR